MSAADGALLDDPDRLLVLLSSALRALRDVDLGGCPLPDATGASCARKSAGRKRLVRSGRSRFVSARVRLPASLLGWLETHRPKEHAVFTHGDCCLPNLFFDGGGRAFFLDLGRAGIADAYTDIALCLRSLRQNLAGVYDGKVRRTVSEDAFFDALGLQPDAEKLRYYTLLDELL
ncbi:MAG: phosphotransferase [Acutalibacteraceae bacterium]